MGVGKGMYKRFGKVGFFTCVYLCKLATAKYYLSIAKSGNNVIRDVFWVYSFQKDNVNVNVNLYSTSTQKITPLMCSICRVLFKKKRQQCTKKTVNLHVRLTQIVLEQVPCRWSSNSEGATAVHIELKP